MFEWKTAEKKTDRTFPVLQITAEVREALIAALEGGGDLQGDRLQDITPALRVESHELFFAWQKVEVGDYLLGRFGADGWRLLSESEFNRGYRLQ